MDGYTFDCARIIAAPAATVWGELRDFIAHTRHMGIKLVNGPARDGAPGDQVGCVRLIHNPAGAPIEEKLTAHSDAGRTFSLTVTPHPLAPMIDYVGTISVVALGTKARCLLRYHGAYARVAELTGAVSAGRNWAQIGAVYDRMFASVAAAVEAPAPAAAPRGRLAGKVCFVTGGASGLGAAITRLFCAEGATVVVADRDRRLGAKVAGKHKGASFDAVDVAVPGEVEAAVARCVAAHGRVDVVINNAGISLPAARLADVATADWERVRAVNLDGAFYVLRAAMREMARQRPAGGVVINMASTSAVTALPNTGHHAYAASKAALVSLTQGAAVEGGADGIRVCAVAPTGVMTPLIMGLIRARQAAGANAPPPTRHFQAIPGMPEPEDVARAALFLASDDARWVSGCVLPVDGAYLAGTAADPARGPPITPPPKL